MVQVRHMGKLLVITLWGTLSCVSHFLLQQRISYHLRCCLKILAPDSISRHLSQFWLFLQLSLSYKPQQSKQGEETRTWSLRLVVGCCSKTSPTRNEGHEERNSWHYICQNESLLLKITKGLLRITPKSSSNYLYRLGNKRVVLQPMYLRCKGECRKSPKIF
jgi:hypothetical protein